MVLKMQKTGETYTEYQKRVLCENSSRLTNHIGVYPQCYDGKKEFEVTITYDNGEQDTLYLCKECLNNLKRENRRARRKARIRSRRL